MDSIILLSVAYYINRKNVMSKIDVVQPPYAKRLNLR